MGKMTNKSSFNYDALEFKYQPFPVAFSKRVIDADLYTRLSESWPDDTFFEFRPNLGKKYSLSENVDKKKYFQFINSSPEWKDLHNWINNGTFIAETMHALMENHIDLGFREEIKGIKKYLKIIKSRIKGRNPYIGRRFIARMEFQMMPADGGCILPHTDTPAKVVTLVVSMQKPGEWTSAFGGGTDICTPVSNHHAYNYLNQQAQFKDMNTVDTYEFGSNQAVVFIKTYDSWHQVKPMKGQDSSMMRKTLIINIFEPK